jgi:hypothetical protein
VAVLPERLRDEFVDAVVDAVAETERSYSLDYVRLNMDARKPASA